MADRAWGGGATATAGVYRRLVVAQVRAQSQYRASFLIDLFGSAVLSALDLITVLVMFRVTPQLGGFDLRAAFLMSALAGCGFACADLLVGNVDRMRQRVRAGTLDALLVRPLGVLPQVFAGEFGLRRTGRAAVGIAALAVAASYAGLSVTPARLVLLVLAPACGTLFFTGFFVAGSTLAFWWIESGEVANAFTYGGRDFTTYPVTVYGGVFRHVFAYGLGFAFVAYYPALVLLGRPDPLGLPGWAGWCSPAVAVAAFGGGLAMWRVGIRRYRSTGS